MYDLPDSRLRLNSNILVNLQKSFNEHSALKVATHEYRGVTYVWEVVRNIVKALALPGGIYNFGSSNLLDSHSLQLKAAEIMGLNDPAKWILPDEHRFVEQPRNLTMDCSRIEKFGICFADSVDGIKEALRRPFRTE